MDSTATGFKTPYMSFQTLWAFLAELSSKPLPPQLDRSMMTTKSGTDQNNIMSALEEFGFVDDAGVVQADLQTFVAADEEDRKAMLKTLMEVLYEPALAVSAGNGTHQNLKDCFRDSFGVSGDTQRKAITFFLHAAQMAGIGLSPHFPKTRSGSGAPGTAKTRKTTPRKKAPESTLPADGPKFAAGTGETVTVDLGAAGSVIVHVDVKWLQLDDDTFTSLRAAIKDLKALAAANAAAPEPPPDDDLGDGAS